VTNPQLVIFSTADMAKAKQFFNAVMGTQPYADAPYYVGYRSGEIEVGLTPQRPDGGSSGPLVYWTVDDIAASIATLTAAGGETVQEPTDVAQGLLVALVKGPDGALVGLRQMPSAKPA
jgi:predicted enzyme related to lactoylglutathione lyase